MLVVTSLKGVLTRPELVRFTGPEVGPFGASRDVVGDGSVILLRTAGHTPGSVSVLVYGGDWDVLCVGGRQYLRRAVVPEHGFDIRGLDHMTPHS